MVPFFVAIKWFVDFDCRGTSIRRYICLCSFPLRAPLFYAHGLLRRLASVALDIHLKYRGVMNESVDGSQCHSGVWKDGVPFPEGLVCGDEHGTAFISCADEFEQHAGLRLILSDVGDVIKDQKMELIEFRNGVF
jgi:hypothetical protein